MGKTLLNGIGLLNIHKQIDVRPEYVLDMFSKYNPRRLQLPIFYRYKLLTILL